MPYKKRQNGDSNTCIFKTHQIFYVLLTHFSKIISLQQVGHGVGWLHILHFFYNNEKEFKWTLLHNLNINMLNTMLA